MKSLRQEQGSTFQQPRFLRSSVLPVPNYGYWRTDAYDLIVISRHAATMPAIGDVTLLMPQSTNRPPEPLDRPDVRHSDRVL